MHPLRELTPSTPQDGNSAVLLRVLTSLDLLILTSPSCYCQHSLLPLWLCNTLILCSYCLDPDKRCSLPLFLSQTHTNQSGDPLPPPQLVLVEPIVDNVGKFQCNSQPSSAITLWHQVYVCKYGIKGLDPTSQFGGFAQTSSCALANNDMIMLKILWLPKLKHL